jgi:hypothetical protein
MPTDRTQAEIAEERRARYEARAAAARAESTARYTQARTMQDVIPFGQPMMPGHHSYKSDRNYRDRIWSNIGKGVEAERRAEELERRAESTGHAITSDASDAPDLIAERIATLEHKQAVMKRRNGIIRKYKGKGTDAVVAALVADGMTEDRARQLAAPTEPWLRPGYPSYALSNNNANIRRLRDRLEELARLAATGPSDTGERDGMTFGEDVDAHRVWVAFEERQPSDVVDQLKRHGFRWAPSLGRWQRQATANGRASLTRVVDTIRPNGVTS